MNTTPVSIPVSHPVAAAWEGQRDAQRPPLHGDAGGAAGDLRSAIAATMALKLSGWICMSASTKQRIGAVAIAAPPLRRRRSCAWSRSRRGNRARGDRRGVVGRPIVGDDHFD